MAVRNWSGPFSLACCICLGANARAGNLNPPVGPVDCSYRTLDQINPATPISQAPLDANGSVLISQPGSYILDTHLIGPVGAPTIILNARGRVELDLGGFSLSSPSTTHGNILILGDLNDFYSIRNGSTIGGEYGVCISPDPMAGSMPTGSWDTEMISMDLTGAIGDTVEILTAARVRFDNITLKRGLISGVALVPDAEITLKHVAIHDMGMHGLHVRGANASGGTGRIDARDYALWRTGGDGICIDTLGNDGLEEISGSNIFMTDLGGSGINIGSSTGGAGGAGKVKFDRLSIKKYSFSAVSIIATSILSVDIQDSSFDNGNNGITVRSGVLARYPIHFNNLALTNMTNFGILFDSSSPSEGGAIYSISDIALGNIGGQGIEVLDPHSNGAVQRAILMDIGGDGMSLAQNVRLSEVQVFNADGHGLVGGAYIDASGVVSEGSGLNNFNLGNETSLRSCVSVNSGGPGVVLGDKSTVVNGFVVQEDRASSAQGLIAGVDLVMEHSTVFGALSVGSYFTGTALHVITDLDHPNFLPSNLTGGKHALFDCEFNTHGGDINRLPFVNITGDDVRIRKTRVMAVDAQNIMPASANRSPPHFITMDGLGYDFQGNTVQNIWSGAEGILLMGDGHLIKNNSFSGDGGAGSIGIIGAADNSIIVGNEFLRMGLSGTPIAVTGAGNVIPTPITGVAATTNCSPDRNLFVP